MRYPQVYIKNPVTGAVQLVSAAESTGESASATTGVFSADSDSSAWLPHGSGIVLESNASNPMPDHPYHRLTLYLERL